MKAQHIEERKDYWAFISYSSKDQRWGEWLHRRLENYPIPADFRGLEVFDGAVLGKNLRPIFRDRDELAGSSDLGAAILKALEASRFLVVLCSKNAAKSKWVNKEIEDFQALGKGKRILALILDGEPNATETGNPDDECFPPALRYPAEPIAGDLRKEGDGKARGFLKILAGIAQLDFDKLYRRHERAMARKRFTAAAVAIALLAGFAALASFAWTKKNEAEASRQVAEASQRKTEAANSENLKLLAKNKAQLHAASMADYSTAIQRIDTDKMWHVGIAHLGRAVALDPDNSVAAVRLYSELSLYATKNQNWPIAVFRHDGVVNGACFSPDGKHVASASDDHAVRIWDLTTGKQLGASLSHEHAVRDVFYSPDGTRIFTVTSDKAGHLWDSATSLPVGAPMHQNDWAISVVFSPDSTHFVTAGGDGFARVWDAKAGKSVGSPISHDYLYLNSVDFSPDGTRFVTSGGDHAEIWDLTSGRRVAGPMKHDKPVKDAIFSPTGRIIATTSGDNAVRLWDATTGNPVGNPLQHDRIIKSLHFSPDGVYIVTSSTDKAARIWEIATGKLTGTLQHAWTIDKAYFSPDGKLIVTLSEFGMCVRLWGVQTQTTLGEPFYHDDWVASVQFSPDGRQLVTASKDNTLRVWSTEVGMPAGRKINEPLRDPASYASVIFPAVSRDHSLVATVDPVHHSAQVWDVIADKRIGKSLEHDRSINSVDFSPEGNRVVTASRDQTAKIWDIETGEPTGVVFLHESSIHSARFSPDGQYVVTAGWDDKAVVWCAVTGKQRGATLFHEKAVNSAQFSPDGTRIVTASDDATAKIWTAGATNPEPVILHHEEDVVYGAFCPQGNRIVTLNSFGHYARIWDANTGALLVPPLLHRYVRSAQFSPDGRLIVTAGGDSGVVQVWDARKGQRIGAPLVHETRVWHAHFNADGTRVITAGPNHVLREWDLSSLLHAPTPVPAFMPVLAQAIAGLFFNDYGALTVMPPEQRLSILRNPPSSQERWAKLARWLSKPLDVRPQTPDSETRPIL